jgi:hypothetical protein
VPANIKTIGVVTVVPSKMHLTRFGMFDTACDWLDISDLQIDRIVFETAARTFPSQYRLVRLTVDRGAEIHTRNTEVMGAFKSFPGIAEQIKKFSRGSGTVDAYLLFWSSHAASNCDMNPGAIGYGFGLSKNLNHPAHIHAFAGLSLIDARTSQIYWGKEAYPGYTRLDGFEWKDSVAQMPAQQRQILKGLIQKIVAAEVATTSRAMLAR